MNKDLNTIASAYKDVNESVTDREIKFRFWSKESLDDVLLRTDKKRGKPESWGLAAKVGLTGGGDYEWIITGPVGKIIDYLKYTGTDALKPGQNPGEVYRDLDIPTQADLRKLWDDGWKEYWAAESEVRAYLEKFRSFSQMPNETSKETLDNVNKQLKIVAATMKKTMGL